MIESRALSRSRWLLLALAVAFAGPGVASAFAADLATVIDDTDPCIPESGGYSGSLRVDYMLYKSNGDPYIVLPMLILVVSNAEFAQLAERLRCLKDPVGLVLIKDIDWEVNLRLSLAGDRMSGRLVHNNQRVHVVMSKDAGKYL